MAVSREHPPSQPALDRDERVAGAEHSYQQALGTFRELGHLLGVTANTSAHQRRGTSRDSA